MGDLLDTHNIFPQRIDVGPFRWSIWVEKYDNLSLWLYSLRLISFHPKSLCSSWSQTSHVTSKFLYSLSWWRNEICRVEAWLAYSSKGQWSWNIGDYTRNGPKIIGKLKEIKANVASSSLIINLLVIQNNIWNLSKYIQSTSIYCIMT